MTISHGGLLWAPPHVRYRLLWLMWADLPVAMSDAYATQMIFKIGSPPQ